MIYIKNSKRRIYPIVRQINDNILNLSSISKRLFRFKALWHIIHKTLTETGLDIDIYLDLKTTGKNPLGFFTCYHFKKQKAYNRELGEDKPFIVIYLIRIFKIADKRDRLTNFKKVLLHELIHYKETLKPIDYNNISNRHHNKHLPTSLQRNKLEVLERALKIGV